jgi:halogenation protein CepH
MSAQADEFDAVVVGGGPGGSTLASLVAAHGHRVLVLEKEKFPRYQIGESLLPSTVHGVCRLTGAADGLAEAGFTPKLGGTFRWGARQEPWTFSFSVSPNIARATSFGRLALWRSSGWGGLFRSRSERARGAGQVCRRRIRSQELDI